MKLKLSIRTLAAFALLMFSAISSSAQVYLLTGERLNRRLPLPVMTLYDERNRQMVLAQNGEIRWFDDVRKSPVKTAMITEVPKPDFNNEELKTIEEATKLHFQMFGVEIPQNVFGSAMLIQRPGGKEFCLTDRNSKFYFYSTETGKLLGKIQVEKPAAKYAPMLAMLSDDNKVVMTQNTQLRKTFVHSLETGKLLLELDTGIFDSAALTTDGNTLLLIRNKNILNRYSVKTGKKSAADMTIKAEWVGNIAVSPAGGKVAFNTYKKNGLADGQMIMDLNTGQTISVDPTLKKFSALGFTPDGKHLTVHLPRYLHFVDTADGKHLSVTIRDIRMFGIRSSLRVSVTTQQKSALFPPAALTSKRPTTFIATSHNLAKPYSTKSVRRKLTSNRNAV